MSDQHRYSPTLHQAWVRAYDLATQQKCGEVEMAHLFLAALEVEAQTRGAASVLLELSGVNPAEARLYALSVVRSEGEMIEKLPPLSREARNTLIAAMVEASKLSSPSIGIEHLLIACVQRRRGQPLGEVLRSLGLDAGFLRGHLRSIATQPKASGSPLGLMNQGSQAAIEAAHAVMRDSFCGQISTVHLLLGVLADRENVAVETLRAVGVDIDELEIKARALITSDGHVATPQKKFSAGAKRALERAKAEVAANSFSLIGPQHLLFGLLPRGTTIQEKISFGSEVFDPLETLWLGFPLEGIEKQYAMRWRPLQEQEDESIAIKPANWVKFDWTWSSIGATWWILLFESFWGAGQIFVICVFSGLVVAIVGEVIKNMRLRDRAASFVCGVIIGIPLVFVHVIHLIAKQIVTRSERWD